MLVSREVLRDAEISPGWGRAALVALFACGCASPTTRNTPAPTSDVANAQPAAAPRDLRTQLDGREFPEGVLALTFDDGPDDQTLELAEYLSEKKISATFFVVGAWVDGVSSDPGSGDDVFATGSDFFPILGDIAALGHRIANHSENHVLFAGAPADVVRAQLRENQRSIDPFIQDELELFRAPGGAWDSAAATAVATDPELAGLVGPVRWDIDRKDWEGSLYCHSSHPTTECEAAAPGHALRVKPSVIAARYLASIDEVKQGIVLLHARVGHVGSRYALDIAHALVPALEARGYLFASPVLHFSPPRVRFPAAPEDTRFFDPEDSIAFALGDTDGDGRADLCVSDGMRVVCAASRSIASPDGAPATMFDRPRFEPFDARGGLYLADVSGDGRADLCARTANGLACATASEEGTFHVTTPWSFEFADASAVHFGDLDGDGKSDVCATSHGVLLCARSTGRRFERARKWLSGIDALWSATVAIGDVDGNGLADICGRRAVGGVACALSNGASFGALRAWSAPGDFVGADSTPSSLILGDLNGDRRADICDPHGARTICALSTGRAFVRSSSWSEHPIANGAAPLADLFADINGDGRSDICRLTADGVSCEVAP